MQQTVSNLLRQGAGDQAAERARQWSALQPDNPQAHRWLAVALFQQGDVSGALSSIGRALALEPDNAVLHQVHGILLLATQNTQAAQWALHQASARDPNHIGAWLLQSQLAMARGDLDEARRLVRLASQAENDHPHVLMLEAMLALQEGEPAAALAFASRAQERASNDPQVLQTVAFACLANGHLDLAEQALRRVQHAMPGVPSVPIMLAHVLATQGRQREAAETLAPLLADPATATPDLEKRIGSLYAATGQFEQALPHLLTALTNTPGDTAVLDALLAAWGALGHLEQARSVLDAALATHKGDQDTLWNARLIIEQESTNRLRVLRRWAATCPHSVRAREHRLREQHAAGEVVAAADTASQLLAMDSANTTRRLYVLQDLALHDPMLAVEKLKQWLAVAGSARERRFLQSMLGLSLGSVGQHAQAVETWLAMHAQQEPNLTPLPPRSTPRMRWPTLAARPENPPLALFLWGAPGSGVDRLASVMRHAAPQFRDDRFGPQPPADGMQSFSIIAGLADGSISPSRLAKQWRQALPSRGLWRDCLDWLPWWDNILLTVLRPYLPEAMLVIALRDPRDTLLEWLAFANSPFALPDLQQAANWLAITLDQVATVHEHQWVANRIIRTDVIGHDPAMASMQINQALQASFPVPPTIGPPRLPLGHWQQYARVLAGPFATLAPVAARLGYGLEQSTATHIPGP